MGAVTLQQIYDTLDRPPNEGQRTAIETLDGPLRIIAGPGSGKTHVLVVRALNLVAAEGLNPSKLVLVTFTDKAAAELQDRLRLYASRLPLVKPLPIAEINVGTIHWFCGTVLRRHHPRLRRYEPLDQLGQQLFIYDRLDAITEGLRPGNRYLGKWQSKSTAIQGVIPWFNKITEETIDPGTLLDSGQPFLSLLGAAYQRYRSAVLENGYLDFSLILRELYELLVSDAEVVAKVQGEYSHFMIDEYQDTNFVQEAVLLQMAAPGYDIAVVGDDDQSLYRFRGAEVRNILEFPDRLAQLGKTTREVGLTVNYRSHPTVIRTYLEFMNDGNWVINGTAFRTGHQVVADPNARFEDYPAALMHAGSESAIADLVEHLINNGVVADPSQIAILFYSVSGDGPPLIAELRSRGIGCYAPRAGQYLDHEEVRQAVGVLWGLVQFVSDRPATGPVADVCNWAETCNQDLAALPQSVELTAWIGATRARWQRLARGEDMGASLLDLLYQAMRFQPLQSHLSDPIAARNLGYLTTLLRTFQQQFRFEVLHAGNRSLIPWRLWTAFFYLLQTTGVDDVETDDEGPPPGLVQVMTIHQSKGLEFPVVIVGSVHKRPRSGKEIDDLLGQYYPRGTFEPAGSVSEFDRRRMFYVAFSRAKHLLVAFAAGQPHRYFNGLAGRLPQLQTTDWGDLDSRIPREPLQAWSIKPVLSLTGRINVYRRCARQYAFFNEYSFVPSFAAQVFFGTVVHQTIEDIHRHVLDKRPEPLTANLVDQYFRRNSELLRKRGIHPLAPSQREEAFGHVMRYFDANSSTLDRVIDTEVEVTLEQEMYVLNGRVDLVRAEDGKIELVDFKAQKRTEAGADFDNYSDQLALYHFLLEERYGQRPDRAILYFTGEKKADQARVRVDVSDTDIADVKARFDATAQMILAKRYELKAFPPRDTCRACDFRHYCRRTDTDPDP